MAEKIKLVQGDTKPALTLNIIDKRTGDPLDVSGTAAVNFKVRAVGSNTVKETIACAKLVGWVNTDGDLVTDAPYDVAGKGGRVAVMWTATSLDTAGEFEGEIEVTFDDGVQTVYDLVKFTVRPQF